MIGVTDNQIAPQFTSPFDNELPGLALHAFATDNILNERYFCGDLNIISSFAFVLLILLMIYFTEKFKDKSAIIYLLFFIGFIIIVFVIQEILYQKLDASYFLLGFAFTGIAQLIQLYFESKEELNISEKEKELLKSLLQKKEEELTSLKKQSEGVSRDKSDILKSEIEKLQEEINRLKENKEDLAEADELKESDAKIFFGMAYRSRQMNEVVELIKKSCTDRFNNFNYW